MLLLYKACPSRRGVVQLISCSRIKHIIQQKQYIDYYRLHIDWQ